MVKYPPTDRKQKHKEPRVIFRRPQRLPDSRYKIGSYMTDTFPNKDELIPVRCFWL